jgi:hypothetical protein
MNGGAMQELEITWPRILRIWWLMVWRGLIGGVVLGFIIGFVIGFIGAMLGFPEKEIIIFNVILGLLWGFAWAMVVTRMALRKRYADFRLVLVPVTS